jgi:hypothetical protein
MTILALLAAVQGECSKDWMGLGWM